MEDFRRQFLLEAAARLDTVDKNLQCRKSLSDEFKRETFRALHTIKGTAQTLDFSTVSALAHALETMLAASAFPSESFQEGIGLLRKSLTDENFQIPPDFLEKTDIEYPAANRVSANLTRAIPEKFLSQLSHQEKSVLQTVLQNEKNLFCLEIGFPLEEFADGLILFREMLGRRGEIVASLPSAKFSREGNIGFQILYATADETAVVATVARDNGAEIIFDSTEKFSANNLQAVAETIARHGKEIAEKDDKRIDFEIAAGETAIADGQLKTVFVVLLHLVRNAVDHAISEKGKIEINLQENNENLHLKVSDDGDGINPARIREKAIEKNLISAGENPTDREIINLIFAPEFSTKSALTDISGRGIGLNAVSDLVEKSGGTINVETRVGEGTAFEIVLPLRQNKSDEN